MPEKSKISPRVFRTLMGMEPAKHANSESQPDNVNFISRFTGPEKKALLNRIYVSNPDTQRIDLSAGGIISYGLPTHQEIAEKKDNYSKMKALAPEIEQAEILMTSSILSPNDLKDGEYIFNFDEISGIGDTPDLCVQISELYDKYFNKELKLGIRSFDWIGKAMYEEGAKAILLLPPAVQNNIRERTKEDIINERIYSQKVNQSAAGPGWAPGIADFSTYVHMNTDADYLYSETKLGWAEYFGDKKQITNRDIAKAELKDMVPLMESFSLDVPYELRNVFDQEKYSRDKDRFSREYVPALEDMVVNLKTRLQEGEVIKVSENPEILRFNRLHQNHRKQTVNSKLKQMYGLHETRIYPEEPLVTLNGEADGIEHYGHPTIIELPMESVIPIFIPGAPSEHLGYFVLINEYGEPLTADQSGVLKDDGGSPTGGNGRALLNSSYEAIFGQNCCRQMLGGGTNMGQMGNAIFQHILDGYMRTRLRNITKRSDLTIGRFNALATTLFYRLLQRKHTTVVFVYPNLLHYFAFEYNDKYGYGRSKLEEIAFLISLRTTFMIADVMSKARSAVDHKKIVIGTDDKNTNLEATMSMAYSVYMAKRRFSAGALDPSEIIRDIYANALTIEPKNVPGLSEFSVSTESAGSNGNQTDSNGVTEYLTNLIISHADVPPSALNQMTEPEYAKSLVTYNLFFAKKVSQRQRTWCSQMSRFIQDYTSYDPIFQTALRKILAAYGRKQMPRNTDEDVARLASQNQQIYHTNFENMTEEILTHVQVQLPSPNIVVNKAQVTEMRDWVENLNTLADQYFPAEMIPGQDDAAAQALPILKAKYKWDQVKKFTEKLGISDMIEPPVIDDIDLDDMMDFLQTLQNCNARLSQQREVISNFPNNSRDNSTSGGMDMGMGMGMDGGMGMDMDMDMGGGMDMGGAPTPGGNIDMSVDTGSGGGMMKADITNQDPASVIYNQNTDK